MNTNELMHRMRAEQPPCIVCRRPCHPEREPGAEIIMVPHNLLPDVISFLVVHQGACRAEAEARLHKGQAAVQGRTERNDHLVGIARRHHTGEDLGPEIAKLN